MIALMERVRLTTENTGDILAFAEELSKSKITEKKGYKILTLILSRYH